MTAPRIEFAGASCRFGRVQALEDLTLTIDAGERVALVGPSGSGKSTLLRLAMGSLRASAGQVRIDGADIARMGARELRAYRRRCRMVSQSVAVPGGQRVHDYVASGRATVWPWWKVAVSSLFPRDVTPVQELLHEVGLAERQWDPLRNLSGGQQQRVAICRALGGAPDLLLADEPTSALDPGTAASVISTLMDAAESSDATVLVSTHRSSELLHRVDRVIALREGVLAFDGPARDVSEETLREVYRDNNEHL